ncbi:acyl-CoA dehydrogenase family protein [Chloroflexota bacterium]
MDFKLTEEQIMMLQMVREFAQKEVKPLSVELDAKTDPKECISWELIEKASKLGLRTLSIPAQYGGGGVDYLTRTIVAEELGAGDQGFGSMFRVNMQNAPQLVLGCNEQQRDEFLPKFLEDDTFLVGVGRTEPNAGTDAHDATCALGQGTSIQTFAERRGDEYIINGSKHFISNGGIAKLFFIFARTNRELPITESLSMFLVPKDTPGFSIGRWHDKLGRRLLSNAELFFEDARIPARYLVGKEGDAWGKIGEPGGKPQAGPTPPWGLVGSASLLGASRTCYEATLDYAKTRVQGGKPIIEHSNVAIRLAEIQVKIEAARGLIRKCAWCWDNKTDYNPKMSRLIKGFTDEMAVSIVNHMVIIFGGMSTDKSMPIEKYLRDIYTTLHGYSTTEMAWLAGAPTL